MNKSVSPTRRYVAVCSKTNFTGYYFEEFTLPEGYEPNNSEQASWYFLNFLNFTACIDGCFSYEDFSGPRRIHPREKAELENVCKHCGVPIYKEENGMWKDKGIIFPQYCSSSNPSAQRHEPKGD